MGAVFLGNPVSGVRASNEIADKILGICNESFDLGGD